MPWLGHSVGSPSHALKSCQLDSSQGTYLGCGWVPRWRQRINVSLPQRCFSLFLSLSLSPPQINKKAYLRVRIKIFLNYMYLLIKRNKIVFSIYLDIWHFDALYSNSPPHFSNCTKITKVHHLALTRQEHTNYTLKLPLIFSLKIMAVKSIPLATRVTIKKT